MNEIRYFRTTEWNQNGPWKRISDWDMKSKSHDNLFNEEAQFFVKENWMAGIYEFQLQVQVVSLYHLWQNLIGKKHLITKAEFCSWQYFLTQRILA